MSLGFFGNASSFPGSHLGPSRFLVRSRHPTSCCPVKLCGSPSQFGSPHCVLNFCIMPSDAVSRPLTMIAFLPEEIYKRVHHEDILAKLLSKLDVSDISCVQFMPNGYVRLTFTSMEARSDAFLSGVFYDTLRLRVFEAQPSVFNVYVHHLPFEVPDRALEEVLSAFGVVHSITEQTYPGSPIYNGSRVVKMTVTSAIPANLRVLRYPCRVFYKDQPMSCFICKKSHRASNCPLRDVCRRCHQPGHFAKDCTDDPVSAASPSAPAAPPPVPAAPSSAPVTPPSAGLPAEVPSEADVLTPEELKTLRKLLFSADVKSLMPSEDDPDCASSEADESAELTPEELVTLRKLLSSANVPSEDDDPDYAPSEAEMSSASSRVDEELPSGDGEVASQVSSVPSSRRSSPSSPAPKSACVRVRRPRFKPKPNVVAARPGKFSKSVLADPPPAQPSVSRSPCPPPVDLLPLSADVLPLSSPSREVRDVT